MQEVGISAFRENLLSYLKQVESGEEILVISKGHVLARIVPPVNPLAHARQELAKLRQKAYVGDVISPVDIQWDAMK